MKNHLFVLSSTNIMWYPCSVFIISLIYPFGVSKAAVSNILTILPLPKEPKSPPFFAELHSEYYLANSAKRDTEGVFP